MVSRAPASKPQCCKQCRRFSEEYFHCNRYFSVMPPSSLEGMIIDKEQSNVFVNTPVKLTARGYDTYFNPFSVDQSKIKWSVSGIEGRFEDNTFYPETAGFGTITASIDGINASTNIMVLDKPTRLILSSKELYVSKGASRTLTVKAADSNGYTSTVNPDNITWTLEGDTGTLEKNTFTATKTVRIYQSLLGRVRLLRHRLRDY